MFFDFDGAEGPWAVLRGSFSSFFVHLSNCLRQDTSPAQSTLTKLADFTKVPSNVVWTAVTLLALILLVKLILRIFSFGFTLLSYLWVRGSVDWKSNRNGGELVAQVLAEHGVKFLFTLVGGHISPILVESEKKKIRVIDCRHEVTTVFAADAVARLSGVPGVAVVTAGPGLTNTVTAVKNAQMAESPVVLMGGAAATLLKGRGALQDIDQLSLFKPICKWTATVNRLRDIVPVLREAFQRCQEGVPGPVFVEFPIDTLYPIQPVMESYGMVPEGKQVAAPKKKGIMESIVQLYLNHHVRQLFAGAWDPQNFGPLPFAIPMFTNTQLNSAVNLVRAAKKPLFLIGSQAMLPPAKPEELRKALEDLGIPCFFGGMARGLLGRQSKLQIRQERKSALREADVVLMIGTTPDFRLDYGRVLSRKSKIIAVSRDRQHLEKNTDMFWKPTMKIQSDAATFVVALQQALSPNGFKVDSEWVKVLVERAEAREKKIFATSEEKTKYINPLRLLMKVDELLDDNCIMVADGGDFVGSAAYIVRPRGPLGWLDPGAFGTLGVGAGFAIGAKLVHPDREVVILYGDGSLGYSIAEYDTYLRHKLPILSLVGNDACWSQIEREQRPRFNSSVACDLLYTDYHVVTDGYGGKGFVVDEYDNVEQVIKAAKEAVKKGKGALVNCLIGKTNFREGSISV